MGTGYSVNAPAVVIRPILLPFASVNQSAPSGPVTMSPGSLATVGTVNCVIVPPVVIFPIELPLLPLSVPQVFWQLPYVPLVNHSAPSGPSVMPCGPLVMPIGNSVITPAVVIRPIRPLSSSVNQRLPSDPTAMPIGVTT